MLGSHSDHHKNDVEYELSEFGQTLMPVLLSLRNWGEAYRNTRGLETKDDDTPP